MIRRPPRSTLSSSSAASDVYKRQEPRLALNYQIGTQSAVKASYNRIYQFVHLLSNSTSLTPTDVWLPSSDNVKPQLSDQWSLGYFRNSKKNTFESSLEVYYKNLQHQIDYRNGADLIFNSTVEKLSLI